MGGWKSVGICIGMYESIKNVLKFLILKTKQQTSTLKLSIILPWPPYIPFLSPPIFPNPSFQLPNPQPYDPRAS